MKTRRTILLLSLTTLFAGASTVFAQGVQNRCGEARMAGQGARHLQLGQCGYECDGSGPGQGTPRRDGSGRLENERLGNPHGNGIRRRHGSGRLENERPGNPDGNGTPRRDRSGGGQGNGRGQGKADNCPNR
jgi:hypothetical protein